MMALIAAASTTNSNPLTLFLPLVLMGGVFYFLLIRPQQKRVRAQAALVNAVEVGDEIMTTGGIFGTVVEIDDDEGTEDDDDYEPEDEDQDQDQQFS